MTAPLQRSLDLRVISLGAGVQSSTMALMAAAGELTPMPSAAIFADTQAEPASVYRWLDWLEARLPFPVRRVTQGDLGAASTRLKTSRKSGRTYISPGVPAYTVEGDKVGYLARQCTLDFKIRVIRREVRRLMEEAGNSRAEQWIGISTDEAHRMKDSVVRYMVNRYPLIERGVSRSGCLRWMESRSFPRPPRSACVFCAMHSDREWLRLRDEEPEEFERAAAYEERFRAAVAAASSLRADDAFLHKSRTPLRLAIFKPEPEQHDLFGNECEGMCGV